MNDNLDETVNEKSQPEDVNESTTENARTWEGRLGKRRFRIRLSRGPNDARLNFQAPFSVDNDPDGVGIPFTSDLDLVWEKGQGAYASGPYAERLANFQRELPERIEKVRQDLEEMLDKLRQNWPTIRESESDSGQKAKGPLSQRVRIEIEESEDPFSDEPPVDSAESVTGRSRLSASERAARRHKILETLQTGTITLEEAENQLAEID